MLEPVNLLGVEGVVQHNRVCAAVSVRQHAVQGLEKVDVIYCFTASLTTYHAWSEGLKSDNGNPVVGLNQLIVSLVVESQRQHTLLLQVGLVNPEMNGFRHTFIFSLDRR